LKKIYDNLNKKTLKVWKIEFLKFLNEQELGGPACTEYPDELKNTWACPDNAASHARDCGSDCTGIGILALPSD
jgi:hypothetical protein